LLGSSPLAGVRPFLWDSKLREPRKTLRPEGLSYRSEASE
jgi:hypothetical protein